MWTQIFIFLGSEVPGHKVNACFNFIRKCQSFPQSGCAIFPPAMFESVNFSTSLSILGSVTPSINLLITNKHFILKGERDGEGEKREEKTGGGKGKKRIEER